MTSAVVGSCRGSRDCLCRSTLRRDRAASDNALTRLLRPCPLPGCRPPPAVRATRVGTVVNEGAVTFAAQQQPVAARDNQQAIEKRIENGPWPAPPNPGKRQSGRAVATRTTISLLPSRST